MKGRMSRHPMARTGRGFSGFCTPKPGFVAIVETWLVLARPLNLLNKVAAASTAATVPARRRGSAKVVGLVKAPRSPKHRQRTKRLRVGPCVQRTKAIRKTRPKNVAAYSIIDVRPQKML